MTKLFLPGLCIIACCQFSYAQELHSFNNNESLSNSFITDYAYTKNNTDFTTSFTHQATSNNNTTATIYTEDIISFTKDNYTKLTARFIYSNESGALCEGFNNIFESNAVSNPNEFNQPDTYKGIYWYTGLKDNGGVHTNSSVLNYWFYLLSNGGKGTNDKAVKYDITGIGKARAEAIAYRTLQNYMQPTSDYNEARTFSIMAAQDLFGKISDEVLQTMNAWNAVGVDSAAVKQKTSSLYEIPADANITNAYTVMATHIEMNAATNQLTVELSDKKPALRNITICDLNDKIIYTNDIKTVQGNNRLQINLPSLVDGTYVLKVDNVHSGNFPVKH